MVLTYEQLLCTTLLLYMLTILTWNKSNKYSTIQGQFNLHICIHLLRWHKVSTLQPYNLSLVMLPLVPVQGIHVKSGEPAIGTYEGFSCTCQMWASHLYFKIGTLSHWGQLYWYFTPPSSRSVPPQESSPPSLLEMAMAMAWWLSHPWELVGVWSCYGWTSATGAGQGGQVPCPSILHHLLE